MMRSLFGSKAVHLRELVQNALEAINQAAARGFDAGSITIESSIIGRKLRVIDDGIGMTKEDLLGKLVVLFHSGWPQDAGTTLGIGQFGFGFYSVFLVADEVEVTSRHRDHPAQACRMTLQAEGTSPKIELLTEPLPPFGTTIDLTLRPELAHLLDTELICDDLKQTHLYTEYPITINQRLLGLPTSAGWCRQFEERGARSHVADWLKQRYSWSEAPIFVEQVEVDNGGWLAVAPEGVSVPPLEVYRRGIAVAKQELIPTPHNLIMTGVVDMRDVGLKPDRETLLDDGNLERLTNSLGEAALKLLGAVASSPTKTMALFGAHRRALTLAMLTDAKMRERLGAVYPVQLYSPTATAKLTPTSLSELAERTSRVIWVGDATRERNYAQRAWKLGQRPVMLEHKPERDLFEKICDANGVQMISAAAAFAEEMRTSAVPDRRLEMLFRAAAGVDCEIICCEDADTSIPVRVLKVRNTAPKLPSLGDLDDPRAKMLMTMLSDMIGGTKGFSVLVIVSRCSPIIELIASPRGSRNGPRTARLLVFVAKISAGIELSSGEQEMFNADLIDQLTESEGLNAGVEVEASPSRDSLWQRLWKGKNND